MCERWVVMTRVSFSLPVLAFVVFGGTAAAQTSSSPILNTVELKQFAVSSAPADQAKVAAHFTALAQRHEADAQRHAEMAKRYVGVPGPRGGGREMAAHCRRLTDLGMKSAATLRELAKHHAALAGGAASVLPPNGAKYEAGAEARQPSEADLARLAGDAKTAADHKALEAYFQAFAKRYDEEADGHAGMATLYRTTSRLAPLAVHCDRLVTELRGIANEARTAAAMHATLAGAPAK